MLSFADATGNLFNRIGRLGKLLSQLRSYQSSQLTNLTDTTTGVTAQYNGESDVQALVGSAYVNTLNSPGSIGGLTQGVARQTVNRMVYRDNPRIAQNLQALNVSASLNEIIRQMRAAGASVRAHTITLTPSSFSGVGDGVINASFYRPFDGRVLENCYAETLLLTCDADSYVGGAVEGNERFFVTGVGSQNNLFAFDWPLGSNSTTLVSAIDGNADNTSGNLLTNSGFEEFTSNTPDDWNVETGTAGTHVFEESSLIYDGSSALRMTGDGSTLISIYQEFGTDTSATLTPLTQYSVNVFARRDGSIPGAGVLVVELVDSNGVVINDELGTANSLSIDLTGLSTSYAAHKAAFRTPRVLPDTYWLRLRMTTALSTGRSVYFDKLSLGQMSQLYTSGPFVAIHAGSVPFRAGEFGTIAVTNSRGSGGSLDTFQTLFARLFSEVLGEELLLPSSGAPTISDSLITS